MEYVLLLHGMPIAFCHTEKEAEAIRDDWVKNNIWNAKKEDYEVFQNFDQNGRTVY